MPIDVRVDRSSGDGAALVAVSGELDLSTAPELERFLVELQRDDAGVVLDLRQLTFMDSSGLRVILGADARARSSGSRLVLVRGAPTVHRVFELTLLDRRLEFVGDPSEAVW
jgi:anti-anti-sigma factor